MKQLITITFICLLSYIKAQESPVGIYCRTYNIWETYNEKTNKYEKPYKKSMEICFDLNNNTLTIEDNIKAYKNVFKILDYTEENKNKTTYLTTDTSLNKECTLIIYNSEGGDILICTYNKKPTFRLKSK